MYNIKLLTYPDVASLAEAWIEINHMPYSRMRRLVASLAEAWIEIIMDYPKDTSYGVASLAEAWIEICSPARSGALRQSRLLRGGVD